MVRLMERSDESGTKTGLRLNLSFWSLVGAVMVALKLKEHYEDYREVPPSPNGATNPLARPASYHDDDDDADAVSQIGLDTTLPTRTRAKRKKGCCVCCGINMSLFCKAFGIVVALFTLWNAIKLVKWAFSSSPSGTDDMPAFSESLGCLDAKHFYHQDTPQGAFYTLPVSSVSGGVDIKVQGAAPGTLTLMPSTDVNEAHVMVRVNIRSSSSASLNGVSIDSASHEEGEGVSWLTLGTPGLIENGACIRYDVEVYVPPTLRNLTIDALSPVHLHTAFDDAPRVLHALSMNIRNNGDDERYANIMKGEKGLQVDELHVLAKGGYIIGALSVGNTTTIDTSYSNTISNVELITSGYDVDAPTSRGSPAHINTYTGSGLSTFTLTNKRSRPIIASHSSTSQASGDGDLRLEYAGSKLNGMVEIEAKKGYSMRGVQSEAPHTGDVPRWVGDKDGGDFLSIKTGGWVGLYF